MNLLFEAVIAITVPDPGGREAVELAQAIEAKIRPGMAQEQAIQALDRLGARHFRVPREKFDLESDTRVIRPYPEGAKWALCGLLEEKPREKAKRFVRFAVFLDEAGTVLAVGTRVFDNL